MRHMYSIFCLPPRSSIVSSSLIVSALSLHHLLSPPLTSNVLSHSHKSLCFVLHSGSLLSGRGAAQPTNAWVMVLVYACVKSIIAFLKRDSIHRAQNKDFKMDDHDGQPILDLVGHLDQLLGYAMPCQWDNSHLTTYAMPCQWDNRHLLAAVCRRAVQRSHQLFQLLTTSSSAHLHFELQSMAS